MLDERLMRGAHFEGRDYIIMKSICRIMREDVWKFQVRVCGLKLTPMDGGKIESAKYGTRVAKSVLYF